MNDDVCLIHGREHMKTRMGDPIAHCEICDAKAWMRAELAAKPEPTDADAETVREMSAQLWGAGLDLEESAFIARMLFRNGQRIVPAQG